MTGWLIALGILILLAILPLGVSVIYNEDGPLVRVIAGFIRLKVFPLKERKKAQKGKEKNQDEEKSDPQKEKRAGQKRRQYYGFSAPSENCGGFSRRISQKASCKPLGAEADFGRR